MRAPPRPCVTPNNCLVSLLKKQCDSWQTAPLLPPTATFTLRLPHVWMLFSFAMQIRRAWLWSECCFWSVPQVHILYVNSREHSTDLEFLFPRPLFSQSVSVHFWMKLFSMLQSSFVVLKCLISLAIENTNTLCHPVFEKCLLSLCNHSVLPIVYPPPIHKYTPPIQPTFPISLWHKTDWGWLVLSWLLRSSYGHSAAGVGGGAGSNSGARPTQGQEAGSSSPAKPAGRWTGWHYRGGGAMVMSACFLLNDLWCLSWAASSPHLKYGCPLLHGIIRLN